MVKTLNELAYAQSSYLLDRELLALRKPREVDWLDDEYPYMVQRVGQEARAYLKDRNIKTRLDIRVLLTVQIYEVDLHDNF